MSLEVDAATGGPYEVLGDVISKAGYQDSSGMRRYLLELLRRNDVVRVGRTLGIPVSEASAIRQAFVDAWGEP